MAEKKRPAPSRPCVKCEKPVHPRTKVCPHCGAEQPQAVKKKPDPVPLPSTEKAELPPILQPTVNEFMRDMGKVIDKYGADTVANFAKMVGK